MDKKTSMCNGFFCHGKDKKHKCSLCNGHFCSCCVSKLECNNKIYCLDCLVTLCIVDIFGNETKKQKLKKILGKQNQQYQIEYKAVGSVKAISD